MVMVKDMVQVTVRSKEATDKIYIESSESGDEENQGNSNPPIVTNRHKDIAFGLDSYMKKSVSVETIHIRNKTSPSTAKKGAESSVDSREDILVMNREFPKIYTTNEGDNQRYNKSQNIIKRPTKTNYQSNVKRLQPLHSKPMLNLMKLGDNLPD